MATHYFDFDSVFSCMDCGNPVAMYKLPLLDGEQDFYRVQSWQESYAAADTLWMNCLSDRFTGNQLTNPFSALNAEGREIAAELSKKLGYKVYYNMFDGGIFYKKFPNGKMWRAWTTASAPFAEKEWSSTNQKIIRRWSARNARFRAEPTNGANREVLP